MRTVLLTACLALAGCGLHPKAAPEKVRQADLSLQAFRAQRPEKPVKIVAWVGLASYYNFAYSGTAKTHYGLQLETDDKSCVVSAWVARDSAAGRKIYEMCKDGLGHDFLLTAAWVGPDGKPTPAGNDGVLVTEAD